MSRPTWAPVSSDTADLLELIAQQEDQEWEFFLGQLEDLAQPVSGDVDPNRLREALRGHVKPSRVGAFTRRALLLGLAAYSGAYAESTDVTSRNRGKPVRVLRWLGT